MAKVFRELPAERLRLAVFDLDGTLIDSRQDLCNSVNATMAEFGLPALDDVTIAGFIGDGAAMLIRRALRAPVEVAAGVDPDDEVFFERAFHYFLSWYREHKLDFTYVYDGVFASLEALRRTPNGAARQTSMQMAVLTNKPVGPARAICEALGLAPYFFNIYGGDSFVTKKPDAEGLLRLMAEAGVAAEETVMVGDSDVDVKTARNAGAWVVGCSFGLSPESLMESAPDVLVDGAEEWATFLR